MTAHYHSKICAIAHGAMEQLFAAGLLDPQSMFEFDLLCRTDVSRDENFAAMRREAAPPNPQMSPPRLPVEPARVAAPAKQAAAAPNHSAPGRIATMRQQRP